MTPEEIINEELAVKIMGWSHCGDCCDIWHGSEPLETGASWSPFTNIAQAILVRDRIRENPFSERLHFKLCLQTVVSKRVNPTEGPGWIVDASEVTLYMTSQDICLATIRYLER